MTAIYVILALVVGGFLAYGFRGLIGKKMKATGAKADEVAKDVVKKVETKL